MPPAAMTRTFSLLLACCLSLPMSVPARPSPSVSGEESAIPEARAVLDAWLEAFNSGERARMEAFRDEHQPKMDVDRLLGFRAETGGLALIRHEPADEGKARALVQERDGETIARIEIGLVPGEPVQLRIQRIERPDDLRIPRLSQAGAIDALVAKADADAAKDAFSGVLLVAQDGDVLLHRAWGLADREAGTPVALDTKFRIGSMNKMFTAVATLQLVQAGKLSLDGTVGQYLPGYPNAGVAQATIRQLLTHTGGTGDIFGPEFDQHRLSLRTHDDYVRLYGTREPMHPAGQEQRYSNYGFVLLGAIIERVSGESYHDYVANHVFAPAGMRDTGSEPETVSVPGRAHGYMRKDGAWIDAGETLPWRGTAAGGGYSTANDLLKFARALQAGTLLSPALLVEATGRQVSGYGYGFASGEDEGFAYHGHGGGAAGMNAELRVYPALGRVVVGVSNLDPPVIERMLSYYMLRMPLAPVSRGQDADGRRDGVGQL